MGTWKNLNSRPKRCLIWVEESQMSQDLSGFKQNITKSEWRMAKGCQIWGRRAWSSLNQGRVNLIWSACWSSRVAWALEEETHHSTHLHIYIYIYIYMYAHGLLVHRDPCAAWQATFLHIRGIDIQPFHLWLYPLFNIPSSSIYSISSYCNANR